METLCSTGGKKLSKINLVVLGGNLVRDPELRYTPSGTAICEFTIANNETWMAGEEKKEKVNFINCLCWGRRGEVISEYFTKGKAIQVKGRLDFQSWENEAGEKRSTIKIKVEDFEFQGQKQDGAVNTTSTTKTPANDAQQKLDINDEEIPF